MWLFNCLSIYHFIPVESRTELFQRVITEKQTITHILSLILNMNNNIFVIQVTDWIQVHVCFTLIIMYIPVFVLQAEVTAQ